MAIDAVTINRAPVLTLWAAVVAERLGFTHDEALTLGRAVAGLNAYSKGTALGIFKPTPKDVRAKREAKTTAEKVLQVELLHRAVPVVQTPGGLRALSKEQPIVAASVEKYLSSKFKEALSPVSAAMAELADSRNVNDSPPRLTAFINSFGRPFLPASRVGERRGRSVWRRSGSWRKSNELTDARAVGEGRDGRHAR
jgi:hypothetical protein